MKRTIYNPFRNSSFTSLMTSSKKETRLHLDFTRKEIVQPKVVTVVTATKRNVYTELIGLVVLFIITNFLIK